MKPEDKTTAHRKKRVGFKITIAIIFFLILGAGVYGFTVYHSVSNTLKKTHEPLKRLKSDQRAVNLSKGDPLSILLLGVDQREGDRGRPDSLILMTVNPDKESIKMVSIPRDTYTDISGKNMQDKINHSYTYGGIDMTVKTAEHFLNIPIDYYVEVNMDGFKELVEAVGGVKVNNSFAFTYGGADFPEGTLTLDGKKALLYSRMRADDPRGDIGRQERQRKIIQAFIKEALQTKTLMNYGSILDAIGNNVKTNLTFNEIKEIQKNYAKARHHLEQLQISGSGKNVDGVYYYFVEETERDRLSTLLKGDLHIN